MLLLFLPSKVVQAPPLRLVACNLMAKVRIFFETEKSYGKNVGEYGFALQRRLNCVATDAELRCNGGCLEVQRRRCCGSKWRLLQFLLTSKRPFA